MKTLICVTSLMCMVVCCTFAQSVSTASTIDKKEVLSSQVSQTSPVLPEWTNALSPGQNDATERQLKDQWIEANPEAYKKMTAPSELTPAQAAERKQKEARRSDPETH